MKKCRKCKKYKKEYYKSRKHVCADCLREYSRIRGKDRVRCTKKRHEENLKRRYNISRKLYNKILKSQDNRCAICRGNETTVNSNSKERRVQMLSVDHCHKGNYIRGLLCRNCNLGLGHFKDNIESLLSAIVYLQEDE